MPLTALLQTSKWDLAPVWIAAALILALAGPADAHRLTVFAWVDGETVHVESQFGSGNPVQGGEVTVTTPDGTVAVTGTTDTSGAFSFKVPKRTDLTVTVSAGMGHQGEWTVRADELGAAPADDSTAKTTPAEAAPSPSSEGAAADAPESPSGRAEISAEAIETAVARAVDRKLAPLMKAVGELQNSGPSLSEIFGGIGYIFGLAGVALYVSARKRRDRDAG